VIWAEQRALREADMVVAVTEDDRKLFQRVIPNKPIHIIPNGFDQYSKSSDAQTSFSKHGKKRVALFLASHSVHNLRALKALRSIFSKPAVSKNWSLWVVGNINPSFELPPNTLKLGPQKNLSDIFSQAEIALNPILSGSGSNVKLIESLGNGCPVLSTPIGARGFPPELSGLHIEAIHNFEERLQSAVPWQKPKVSELACYQWQEIGSQYCQLIQPYLNS
jgi:glycosyltransferase involved in cell wall biosynthesis